MKSESINRWLTLGANVGILIGLVLVIVEIRQNSDLVRLQFINDDLLALAQTDTPMLGDNAADVMMKAMYNPEELTYADFRVIDAYLISKMDLIYRRYRLGQEGIIEADAWKKDPGFTFEWLFGNRVALLWWKYEGRVAYGMDTPEIVEFVDSRIEGITESTSIRGWERIRSELQEDFDWTSTAND